MDNNKLIEVVTAAKNGDKDAMNVLFSEFYDKVYYFALKTVKDEELALDITQESFIDVINNVHKLKEPVTFVAWLNRITYHQCTRYFKKRKDVLVESNDEDEGSIFDTIAEDNADFIPDEAIDNDEFRKTILSMIDDLTEEQRSAVLLFYYEEMSVKQIAEIQGVSEGTVKSRLNYARKSIKKSIEDYEEKNGIKLHAIPFFPFFKWLFDKDKKKMPPAAVIAVSKGITTATGVAITTSATTSTGIAALFAGIPLGVKIAGGTLAVLLIIAGLFAATKAFGSDDTDDEASYAGADISIVATEAVVATSDEVMTTVPTEEATTAPATEQDPTEPTRVSSNTNQTSNNQSSGSSSSGNNTSGSQTNTTDPTEPAPTQTTPAQTEPVQTEPPTTVPETEPATDTADIEESLSTVINKYMSIIKMLWPYSPGFNDSSDITRGEAMFFLYQFIYDKYGEKGAGKFTIPVSELNSWTQDLFAQTYNYSDISSSFTNVGNGIYLAYHAETDEMEFTLSGGGGGRNPSFVITKETISNDTYKVTIGIGQKKALLDKAIPGYTNPVYTSEDGTEIGVEYLKELTVRYTNGNWTLVSLVTTGEYDSIPWLEPEGK